MSRTRQLRLPNGLRATLAQTPGAAAGAALVRVAAGSHDEPAAHPGLAHFLEHLLFLGGRAYRDEQRLMPWVQARGGRLNASTRARHTEYFFEVPAADLGDGLLRLADMLERPALARDAQLREREVLEAEYIARSADADTLIDAALAAGVAAGHPLRRFVAGRRASLAVETDDFQRALADFHGGFYHPGNLELWLQGPQSLDELQALVERACAAWPSRARPARQAPPPLLPFARAALGLRLPGTPRLVLAFALERLDAAAEGTLERVGALLAEEADGGLLAYLIEQGLADAAGTRVAYRAEEQTLLLVSFELLEASAAGAVEAAFLDWLRALRACPEALDAADEFPRLAPLEQVRRRALGQPCALRPGWLAALDAVHMLRLLVAPELIGEPCEVAGFALTLGAGPGPLAARPPLPWNFPVPLAPSTSPAASVQVRWRFPLAPRRGDFLALRQALRPLAGQARLGGVELRLDAEAGDWVLALRGPRDRLADCLGEALARLTSAPPDGERLLRREVQRQASELPIRRLIAALPEALSGATDAAPDWPAAHWDALAEGIALPPPSAFPGQPAQAPLQPAALPGGWHWRRSPDSAEAALLLFCPLADRSPPGEARWRLLARALEPGFQRRLRSELGLGYALYCGFRQVAGWRGILFAVQSPSAEPEALLQHLREFLQATPPVPCAGASLIGAATPDDAWLDRLAGIDTAHREQLEAAARQLSGADLATAHAELLAATGGWWLLANRG
ncbi:pyrroloquinoline quinone biosynthesis protein PqqF [Pseudomonas citronellolis]|uniref:pyrroloquinoline quinone biosynthesis protein PqqF n=1 Tax=Pseudomonas citronellolis TaxID=53408 RepID=UPI0023E461CF|nr:pyrroloquinoline quinone biosynthesis protein PqqF [Pseudomonas citronellolis]MDF3933607.1 pyrroloquinoline quinone biosynthesis protein PqqF [Pseudomonas citronellolis]